MMMMMMMITTPTTTTMIHDSSTGMMATILTIPRSEGGRGFINVLNIHYKQVTSPYEYFFFNQQSLMLVLIMDMGCVLCEVQIEFLFTNLMNASLQRNTNVDKSKHAFQICTTMLSRGRKKLVFCLSQIMTEGGCSFSAFIAVCHFCMNQVEKGRRSRHHNNDWDLQVYSQLNRQIVLKYPVWSTCLLNVQCFYSSAGSCVRYSCHLHVHLANRWQRKFLCHSGR